MKKIDNHGASLIVGVLFLIAVFVFLTYHDPFGVLVLAFIISAIFLLPRIVEYMWNTVVDFMGGEDE